MDRLDPDSILDKKIREICEENSEIAKALTENEGFDGDKNVQ